MEILNYFNTLFMEHGKDLSGALIDYAYRGKEAIALLNSLKGMEELPIYTALFTLGLIGMIKDFSKHFVISQYTWFQYLQMRALDYLPQKWVLTIFNFKLFSCRACTSFWLAILCFYSLNNPMLLPLAFITYFYTKSIENDENH